MMRIEGEYASGARQSRDAAGDPDRGVVADRFRSTLAGAAVYGAVFEGGEGYRNDNTSGLPVGEEAQSVYAVMGGNHYNDVCCFDYGNAENHIGADGPGTMEAIYFGSCTSWWSKEARAGIPARASLLHHDVQLPK